MAENDIVETVKKELVQIGIIPLSARTVYENVQVLTNAFPLLTNDSVGSLEAQEESVHRDFSNVFCLGRSMSSSQGMISVLRDVYEKVNSLY